jgi:hypothetical protein
MKIYVLIRNYIGLKDVANIKVKFKRIILNMFEAGYKPTSGEGMSVILITKNGLRKT